MSGNSEPRKYKNPVLNWIEFRLPIISYFQKEYGEYPMPKNCNYFWSFGALATITLITMIVSGIFLAMNYTPHTVHYWFKRIGVNRQNLGPPEIVREEAAKIQNL